MKKELYTLLILGGLILSSCSSSFLDLYPETSVTSGTFYKTSEQFEQAINSAYVGLRNICFDGMFMDEMRSDNAFYTLYSAERSRYNYLEKIALFIDDETSANGVAINDRWVSDYSNIAKANAILDRADASEMTDAEKTSYKAEALFLRAFYYFDLVKCFGGVPLSLHEVTNTESAFLARSSEEDCYTQILKDVTDAISLGLPIPSKFPADNGGRATMGAAKMLRAYVNMTKSTPDYTTTETDLKDITKMNYKLLSNYADCFNPKNKNMEETILDAQYTEDGSSDQYSTYPFCMAPKCSNLEDMMGSGGSNYSIMGIPRGTSGGWVVPTKRMVDSYEDGDLRLPESIVVVEGHSEGENFYYEKFVDAKGYTCPNGKDYRYMVKKYYHPPYTYSLRANENFPIYRYSGALLLLSECLVDEGKASEALPYINQVRARAGLKALSSCSLENVSNEMKHELAFENHRWSDLKRMGKAKSVMAEYGKYIKELYPWVKSTNNDGCFIIDDFRMIYAIPTRELEINSQLQQNPGY